MQLLQAKIWVLIIKFYPLYFKCGWTDSFAHLKSDLLFHSKRVGECVSKWTSSHWECGWSRGERMEKGSFGLGMWKGKNEGEKITWVSRVDVSECFLWVSASSKDMSVVIGVACIFFFFWKATLMWVSHNDSEWRAGFINVERVTFLLSRSRMHMWQSLVGLSLWAWRRHWDTSSSWSLSFCCSSSCCWCHTGRQPSSQG